MHLPQLFFIGIIIGMVVVIDPFVEIALSRAIGMRLGFPYLASFVGLTLASGSCYVCFRWGQSVLWYKDRILIVLILASPQFKALSVGFLDLVDIPLLLLFCFWAVGAFNKKQIKIIFNPPIHLSILIIVFSMFMASYNGGIGNVIYTIKILKSVVYSLLLMILIKDKNELWFLLKAFFIITAVSSLIAIFQEIIFLTMDTVVAGNVSVETIDLMLEYTSYGVLLRTPAFTGDPHLLGRSLLFSIVLLVAFMFGDRTRVEFNRRIYIVSLVLMSAALPLLFSRPTWMGVFLSLLVYLILKKRELFIHFMSLAILLVMIGYFTGLNGEIQDAIKEEISLGGDFHYRLTLAKETLEKIERHPFIGTGLNKVGRYNANIHNWPAHNGFISAYIRMGILGFIVYCFVFLYFSFHNIAIFLERKTFFRDLGLGMVSVMAGYLLILQFEPTSFEPIYFIYMIAINASIIFFWKKEMKPVYG